MFSSLAVVDAGPLTRRVAGAAHELGVVTTLVSAGDSVRETLDAGAVAVHAPDADAATQLAFARACAATGLTFVGAGVEALAAVVDRATWTLVAAECDIDTSADPDGRRVDVQVLADRAGEVVHLREREITGDDSVVMAPAPRLAAATRAGMCRDAVRLVGSLGLAGVVTVSFAVDDDLAAVRDVLPGLQLAHTVTEEVTNVDLAQAQLHLAWGTRLIDLGLTQESIIVRGVAIQCRVTAERAAGGRWQTPGGPGIRIDADPSGPASRLVAVMTCRGRDLVHTVRRTRRALTEFGADERTNVPELRRRLTPL